MPKISKYNGGYVIISLNDDNIYEKIERNLYKPILLTDIVINGIEKNDVFTTAYVADTNIIFKDIYDKDIIISNDNSVSIVNNNNHLYIHYLVINESNYDSKIYFTLHTSNYILINSVDKLMKNFSNYVKHSVTGLSENYEGHKVIIHSLYLAQDIFHILCLNNIKKQVEIFHILGYDTVTNESLDVPINVVSVNDEYSKLF